MAESTATGTDQTVAIRPAEQSEQTAAIQPAGRTEQTVAIRPAQLSEQTVRLAPAELAQRLKAIEAARAAARSRPKAIEAAPVRHQTPELPQGFEDVGATWWCAVAKVHEALLSEAELPAVCEAYDAELRARWGYAKTLHEQGYEVPEYLTERAPIAPLWPLPPLPDKTDALAHAA